MEWFLYNGKVNSIFSSYSLDSSFWGNQQSFGIRVRVYHFVTTCTLLLVLFSVVILGYLLQVDFLNLEQISILLHLWCKSWWKEKHITVKFCSKLNRVVYVSKCSDYKKCYREDTAEKDNVESVVDPQNETRVLRSCGNNA